MIRYLWILTLIVSLFMPQRTYAHISTDFPRHQTVEQGRSRVQLSVTPEEPIVGVEAQITASGTWPDSCVPLLHDVIVRPAFDGFNMTIEGTVPNSSGCDERVTDWSITAPITFEESALTMAQFIIIDDALKPTSLAHATTHFFVHRGIVVQPFAPVVDEPIQLSVSGWTISCEPEYLSHTIEDQTITLQIGVPEEIDVCGAPVEEWTEEVNIGPLSAGIYRVEAYVRLFEYESSRLLHTLNFTVGENADGTADEITTGQQHQIFMPIIKKDKRIIPSSPCSNEALLAKIC